jgi:hypothetical protein
VFPTAVGSQAAPNAAAARDLLGGKVIRARELRARLSNGCCAQFLPEPFMTFAIRALPIVLIFSAIFYSLWRARARRRPALV